MTEKYSVTVEFEVVDTGDLMKAIGIVLNSIHGCNPVIKTVYHKNESGLI